MVRTCKLSVLDHQWGKCKWCCPLLVEIAKVRLIAENLSKGRKHICHHFVMRRWGDNGLGGRLDLEKKTPKQN